MRRSIGLGGLALVVVIAVLWLTGGLDGLAGWLRGAQEAAQNRLAGAIRALRGGRAGGRWRHSGAVCFGYGVLHAAGPGHGKLLIGSYGVARRVPMGPLAGLALAPQALRRRRWRWASSMRRSQCWAWTRTSGRGRRRPLDGPGQPRDDRGLGAVAGLARDHGAFAGRRRERIMPITSHHPRPTTHHDHVHDAPPVPMPMARRWSRCQPPDRLARCGWP